MFSLIIDTTTERGVLAFAQDFSIIKEIQLPFGLQNSKHALPLLRDSLIDLNLKASDFDEVICGIGPGSYTGIRVGASVAMSFSFAHNIPLIGVSSLQAYKPHEEGDYMTIIDAKMGGAYISINAKAPEVISLKDLQSKIEEKGIRQFLTPVAEPIKTNLSVKNSNWYEMAPSAFRMLELSKGQEARISTDSSLDLLYLQAWKPSGSY